jgi:hypothetical protein
MIAKCNGDLEWGLGPEQWHQRSTWRNWGKVYRLDNTIVSVLILTVRIVLCLCKRRFLCLGTTHWIAHENI